MLQPIGTIRRPGAILPMAKALAEFSSLVRRHVTKSLAKLPSAIRRQLPVAMEVVTYACLFPRRQSLEFAVTVANHCTLVFVQTSPGIEPVASSGALIRVHVRPAPGAFGETSTPLRVERVPSFGKGFEHLPLFFGQCIPIDGFILRERNTANAKQQRCNRRYQISSSHRSPPPLSPRLARGHCPFLPSTLFPALPLP